MKNNKVTLAIAVATIVGALALVFVGNASTPTENEQATETVAPTPPKEPETVTVDAAYAIYDQCKDVSRKVMLSEDQGSVYSIGTNGNVCLLDSIGERHALLKVMQKKTKYADTVYQTAWNGYTVYWQYTDGKIMIRIDSNGQTVTTTVEQGLDA